MTGQHNDLVKRLEDLRQAGFVIRRTHPDLPLSIWNYSRRAYDLSPSEWPLLLQEARGLVTDASGRIVARAYSKFWNGSAVLPGQDGPWSISEKIDGHLVLAFLYEGEMVVCSRGSFTSWEAATARRILKTRYPHWRPAAGETCVFELVSPEKPVILRYPEERLYLLDVFGPDGSADCLAASRYCFFPFPERRLTEAADLSPFLDMRCEGFVVRNLRTGALHKVKTRWYEECHRLYFGPLSHIGRLYLEQGREEALKKISLFWPERADAYRLLSGWIFDQEAKAHEQVYALETALAYFNRNGRLDRKSYAQSVLGNKELKPYSAWMFQLYDGRDIFPDMLRKTMLAEKRSAAELLRLPSDSEDAFDDGAEPAEQPLASG